MKARLISLALLACNLAMPGPAQAKGCLKGAVVGGAVGHLANHHGVAGAAAGCVIGHHRAQKQAARSARAASSPATQTQ
jgi:hypothetical protein